MSPGGGARRRPFFAGAPLKKKMLPAKKIVQDVKVKSHSDVMGISGHKGKINKKYKKKM